MEFVVGSYTGTTGSTTFQFPNLGFRCEYMFYAGACYGSIIVFSATNATVTKTDKNGTTQTEISGSNYQFTVTGLTWYANPIAFFIRRNLV